MNILAVLNRSNNDFGANYVCEHCGKVAYCHAGYDDAYFHQNVIPRFGCPSCGLDRAGEPSTMNNGWAAAK